MPIYAVMTPTYEVVEVILEDGSGPSEFPCDYVEVEATNRREARQKGYRLLKGEPFFRREWEHNCHPYACLKVERLEAEAAMGVTNAYPIQ